MKLQVLGLHFKFQHVNFEKILGRPSVSEFLFSSKYASLSFKKGRFYDEYIGIPENWNPGP